MFEERIQKTLEFVREAKTLSFDGDRYIVSDTEKELLEKNNIPYEEYGDDLRLQLKKYFQDVNLKYSEALSSDITFNDVYGDFFVFDRSGTFVKFQSSDLGFTCYGKENKELLLHIRNTVAYYRIFNFLRADDFCDYFNDANNEIVIYSSVNGVFKIKYDTIPVIDFGKDIENDVNKLIEIAQPIQLTPFFKNSIFTLSNGTGIVNLKQIIAESEILVSITKRDYELVAKKFDFEKFKDSLYKEKGKYFTNIREIVNKIFGQAVGIPISISATVFATYKVSDDVFMLFIVLLAFLVYQMFYIRIQLVYRADIIELKDDFIKDFEIIKNDSGLSPVLIETQGSKILGKIDSSISMIFWLIAIVSFLGLLVCFYIGYEIAKSEAVCMLTYLLK